MVKHELDFKKKRRGILNQNTSSQLRYLATTTAKLFLMARMSEPTTAKKVLFSNLKKYMSVIASSHVVFKSSKPPYYDRC